MRLRQRIGWSLKSSLRSDQVDPSKWSLCMRKIFSVDNELKKLMAPIGNSSLPVGRSDALVSVDKAIADKLQIPYVC